MAYRKMLAVFGLTLIGIVFYVWVSSPLVVTVNGSSEVKVPAGYATVGLVVSETAATSSEAIARLNSKSGQVTQLLQLKGIRADDITTGQPSIFPAAAAGSTGGGFTASVNMTVKIMATDNLADLMSNLYSTGATVVTQPVISSDNQEELEQKAFTEAMKDAQKQAARIARNKWKLIKKVVAIAQADSGQSTVASGESFKLVKTVAVSYKMW